MLQAAYPIEVVERDGHLVTFASIPSFTSPTGRHIEGFTRYNGRTIVIGAGYTREAAEASVTAGIATYFGPCR